MTDRPPPDGARLLVAALLPRFADVAAVLGDRCADLVLADELASLSGPRLPGSLPGMELAFRYLPLRGGRLGGDWFDAVPLPGGRTALVIGDVTGHGPRAAVLMTQCKAMARALAALDLPPDRLLTHFDGLVRRLGEECGPAGELLVTCAYLVYDPATRECVIGNAGHVPALLVHPGGRVEVLRSPSGAPLGVGLVPFRTATFQVPEGALLVLHTDGLTEDATELAGHLHDLRDEGLDRLGGLLMDRLRAADRRDDLTLVLARPSVPASVPAGRWSNLPRERTTFTGRTSEVAQVQRLLRVARLVTVTGPGGVGKSRLVRQAAAGLHEEFPDGVRLVGLSAVRDPELLPRAVGEALGPLPEVEDRRLLLILDDCEHLAQACAAFARSLLRAAPGVRVVVAGRQPLGVTGEHTLVLEPLEAKEAVRLLAGRLPFPLEAADRPAAARLCADLDGLPLAVELAAARMRGPADLRGRAEVLSLAAPGGTWGPPHHSDMRAVIGRSHELCEPLERLLWARLSVFTEPFELPDAEYVCADASLPGIEVLHLLSGLVRRSVVLREPGGRYRLLAGYQAYGREHLARLREHAAVEDRHRAWSAGC